MIVNLRNARASDDAILTVKPTQRLNFAAFVGVGTSEMSLQRTNQIHQILISAQIDLKLRHLVEIQRSVERDGELSMIGLSNVDQKPR